MVHNASVDALVVTLALVFSTGPYPLARHDSQRDKSMAQQITIRIGDKAFAATLSDNPTAAAFAKLLPLSITMAELNRNEKFARLSTNMPVRASTPASIRTGDLMLYGSNTLVLFYKSFQTTYSYTVIGRIDEPAGLELALGAGDVDVSFALDKERH
jgi:hypothetical protein